MIRIDTEANYKAVFFNGKTVRQRLDSTKSITAPKYPEIEDVAINSLCYANCSYCYTSATKHGKNFENIVEKAEDIWGSISQNNRPFQIAIGGAGESTLHPKWIDFIKTVNSLGIVPNYTTNGMHLTEDILITTEKYCGGVALSYHPHIKKEIFNNAIRNISGFDIRLNLHLIIGDTKSLFDAKVIYETYKDNIEYFVMLPYQASGRGIKIDTEETWKELFLWISTLSEKRQQQFAFGALFYEFLLNNPFFVNIDIYQPEIYSGYRMMDDTYKVLRKSSYNLEPK